MYEGKNAYYDANKKTKQLSKIMKIDVPGAIHLDVRISPLQGEICSPVCLTDKVALTFQDAKIRERNAKLVRRATQTKKT